MICKGFVLLKINSSQSAFYIITPLAYRDWFLKRAIILKNCRKLQTQRFVCEAEWWGHVRAEWKHPALCVDSGVKFNIWDVVSAV